MNDTNPWTAAGRRVAEAAKTDAAASPPPETDTDAPGDGPAIGSEETPEHESADHPSSQASSQASTTAPVPPKAPPPVTGAPAPQTSVTAPGPGEGGLPVRMVRPTAELWIVGAHGGAGESTLATLQPTWAATEHTWPTPSDLADHCATVLVARTNAAGLRAAQSALRQWASGVLGPHTDLLGLVLLADAPGRLPKPLRALVDLVSGGAPRTWQIGWLEEWRVIDPGQSTHGTGSTSSTALNEDQAPQLTKQLGRLVAELSALTGSTPPA